MTNLGEDRWFLLGPVLGRTWENFAKAEKTYIYAATTRVSQVIGNTEGGEWRNTCT